LAPARGPTLAIVAMLMVPPASLLGQTAPGSSSAHTCNACHAPHTSGGAAVNLRLGTSAVMAAYSLPGLGDASASCLRCHATPEIRERETSREWGQVRLLEGRFLGFDLSDDHPLGHVNGKVVDRLALLRPLLEAERQAAGRSESPVIECANCHDPHDRAEAVRNPANNDRCTACHDERRYGFASHSSLGCASCHELHGGSVPGLLAERYEDLLCISCHLTPGRAGGSADRVRAISAPAGHVVTTMERCASCHPPHGSG